MTLLDIELFWGFLDKFPQDGQLDCLGGVLKISASRFKHLKSLSSKLADSFRYKIKEEFNFTEGERFVASAGNVTSAFSLPTALSSFSKRFPRIPFFAKRVESSLTVWQEEFEASKSDLMMFALNIIDGVEENYLNKLVDFSKSKTFRRFVDDFGYLSSSKSLLNGQDPKHILKTQNILFGRLKSEGGRNPFYFSSPPDRGNEEPRIISDHYFMSFLLMENEAGIWHTFNASYNPEVHKILYNKPIVVLRRHVLGRVTLPKKFNFMFSSMFKKVRKEKVK